MSNNSKLIFGCGYLGRRVAGLWRSQGADVLAVTRRRERFVELENDGLQPVQWDITDASEAPTLPAVGSVLYAVGYDRGAGVDMRTVYVDGLRRVLDALPESVERFLYISTTGVYGQNDGEMVDEDSPTVPTRSGGQVCLEAENVLRSHPIGERAVIFRLAGIYGPGRLPRLEAIREGKPLQVPRDSFLNLIHVEDAARIVLLAERQAPTPRTYLVSDGHPVKRRTFYEELARRTGSPRPTFLDPTPEEIASTRAESNKRLDIRRLLMELPLTLQYPNYRHGLKALLSSSVA